MKKQLVLAVGILGLIVLFGVAFGGGFAVGDSTVGQDITLSNPSTSIGLITFDHRPKTLILNLPGIEFEIIKINWQDEIRCYDMKHLLEHKQFKEMPCQ